MEVLYHIRPYVQGIFPYIGLIYGRFLRYYSDNYSIDLKLFYRSQIWINIFRIVIFLDQLLEILYLHNNNSISESLF